MSFSSLKGIIVSNRNVKILHKTFLQNCYVKQCQMRIIHTSYLARTVRSFAVCARLTRYPIICPKNLTKKVINVPVPILTDNGDKWQEKTLFYITICRKIVILAVGLLSKLRSWQTNHGMLHHLKEHQTLRSSCVDEQQKSCDHSKYRLEIAFSRNGCLIIWHYSGLIQRR